ncbi:MAG: hypothetical protein ACHQJ6_09495 [Candidatus Berkiellales bacterium]
MKGGVATHNLSDRLSDSGSDDEKDLDKKAANLERKVLELQQQNAVLEALSLVLSKKVTLPSSKYLEMKARRDHKKGFVTKEKELLASASPSSKLKGKK